jgi:hypothetical protein
VIEIQMPPLRERGLPPRAQRCSRHTSGLY